MTARSRLMPEVDFDAPGAQYGFVRLFHSVHRSAYGYIPIPIVVLRTGLCKRVRLSENELAARFGTSRAPVREPLIRLVADGMIEVWPQTAASSAACPCARHCGAIIPLAAMPQHFLEASP